MKRIILPLIVALAILVTPPAAFAESPPAEGETVTILGYGTASAPPDAVSVRLHVSLEPTYGPGGPELAFIDLAELEIVRDALIEHGLDADDLEMDPFSSSYSYGPSGQAGEFRFVYSDVAGLRTFLDLVLEYLDDNKGPKLNAASFVFLVEDCGALEAQAMQAAFDDARARAETLAAVLGKTPGNVISVSEETSSQGADSPVKGCISLDVLEGSGGNLRYFSGTSSGLENSILKVEVGILLEATFSLESDQ